jgi:hypothetical protein
MPARVIRIDLERERRRVLAAMPGRPESVAVLPFRLVAHPDAVEFVIGDEVELWLTPGQACDLANQLSATAVDANAGGARRG